MPSPLGHALGGAIVALLTAGATRASSAQGATRAVRCAGSTGVPGAAGTTPARSPHLSTAPHLTHLTHPRQLVHLAVCACLPDLDFLWGRHNMQTHSVGFAVMVGLVVLAWRRDRRLAFASTLAVLTHVLFDWLGSDDFPPLGVMALWPLTSQFYFADAFIFEAISRRYWLPGFVQHNVLALVREIAILGPIAGALWWWRLKRKGHGDTETRRT